MSSTTSAANFFVFNKSLGFYRLDAICVDADGASAITAYAAAAFEIH